RPERVQRLPQGRRQGTQRTAGEADQYRHLQPARAARLQQEQRGRGSA
ncbi:hypothetical protein, partial [Pseudomonas savastanoi]